jgi:glutathione synthase/RimK-type ligase-like ATP-grasp enzyme
VYYTKLHINSQLGAWICQDKSLARKMLEIERLPNIPFCHSNNPADVNRFFDQYHPVIRKPVSGMKSQDVRLISARDDLDPTKIRESIFEQYIRGMEYRYLLLNGEVVGVQQKRLDPIDAYPWRKHIINLEEQDWNQGLASMTRSIAGKLHMRFIAVDFILDASGKAWILELNGMPGLHSFHHPDSGSPHNMAKRLMAAILDD